MIILETNIEEALARVEESEDVGLIWLDQFNEQQKDYRIYLDEEVLKLLNEQERDVLLFVHSILYHILSQKKEDLIINLNKFFDQEEKNWNLYESLIREPFNERLNPFFDIYKEEEGLAFIEDCLTQDEEEDLGLTPAGRDIIWNVSSAFLIQLTKQI